MPLPRYLRRQRILGVFLAICIWFVTLLHAATVQLTWDAPVWPAGQTPMALMSYVLERDGVEIARPVAPPYGDTVESGTYTYTVRALYAGAILSEQSNAVAVTVAALPFLAVPINLACVFVPGTVPTFTCQAANVTPQGPYPLRPVGTVTVKAVDSQEIQGEDGRAINAVDGNPATKWVTQWVSAQPPLPHILTLDLGVGMWCDGLRYLPRQDGNQNGNLTSYRVEGSPDLATWTVLASGSWMVDASEKIVRFAAVKYRYVRLVGVLSNGTPYANAAEVGVFAVPGP